MYVLMFILGTFLGGIFAFCILCMFVINRHESEAEYHFIEKQERNKEGGASEQSKRT